MDQRIKLIEDLSLNAWPSHQIQIYDGWLLRFSYNYTHRTNCVEQIGHSSLPLDEKIDYCEHIYAEWGSPCIFKISPLLTDDFDKLLEKRGYIKEHHVHNMILDLEHSSSLTSAASIRNEILPNALSLTTSPIISDEWMQALFRLKNTTNAMHRQIVPHMYAAIPKRTICVSLRKNKEVIATGLGILDRNHIGIYAIHVHPDFRRMHLAQRIVSELIYEGHKAGATHAYLQVVSDNNAAMKLYRKMGFSALYDDWFRVKSLPTGNH